MNGVYPGMVDGLFGTRKGHLETRLKEALGHYAKIFPELRDPDHLVKYLENRDPKIRELFLETDQFVNIMYNRLDSIPEYLRDAIVIVMMFSIIETLQVGMRKYVKLAEWLQSQESARRLDDLTGQGLDSHQKLSALTKIYSSKYGSTHAALDFFENYLSQADKKSLIRTYETPRECLLDVFRDLLRSQLPDFDERMTLEEVRKALGDQAKTERRYLPVCYAPTCYVHYDTCDPSLGCSLDSDQDLLKRSLDRVVKGLLYAYRNAFVHKSNLPMIPEGTESSEATVSRIVYDHLDDRFIAHTLDLDFLLKAFGASLRQFFDTAAVA
jgi:hypothetical protein